MTVQVVCFGAMRAYLPSGSEGNRVALEVTSGARVADIVAALGAPERLIFAVLVDGQRATLEQGLEEGAEVTLMPPFAGGS